MVKLPGFDELKKIGSSLIDSAKSVNISEKVDKLKSKVESMSSKKEAVMSDEASVMLAAISASLNEVIAVQAVQASAIKKIQGQLADLAKVIEAGQKPAAPTTPVD